MKSHKNTFRKQTVCVVSPFLPRPGGVSVQAEILCRCLRKEGVKVYKINTHMGQVRPISIIRKLQKGFLQPIMILSKLLKVIKYCDVIQIQSASYWGFMPTLIAVIVGKTLGKRIIVAYYGGEAKRFLGQYRVIVTPILKKVNAVLVPSKFLRDVFKKYGIDTEIIPSFIETDKFKYRERKTIKPNFLFARHLEETYNPIMVIRAFRIIKEKIPEAKLKIIGSGVMEDRLKSLVEELNLGDDIDFIGRVDFETFREAFNTADIFLNTSSVDNMPLTLIEASVCGLPIISTNAGGIPLLIRNSVNGLLVNINDHVKMAEYAIFLLQNPEKACELGRNARRNANKFSWQYVKEQLMPMYS